jgi:leucine dehydrogenase
VDHAQSHRCVEEFSATLSTPDAIFDVTADVFAPCALGGVINDDTIDRLRVQIVAGSANNPLLEDKHGDILNSRGISYAPDCIANSGGLINGCRELLGWTEDRARERVDGLYDQMLAILKASDEKQVPPFRLAYEKAREILR